MIPSFRMKNIGGYLTIVSHTLVTHQLRMEPQRISGRAAPIGEHRVRSVARAFSSQQKYARETQATGV